MLCIFLPAWCSSSDPRIGPGDYPSFIFRCKFLTLQASIYGSLHSTGHGNLHKVKHFRNLLCAACFDIRNAAELKRDVVDLKKKISKCWALCLPQVGQRGSIQGNPAAPMHVCCNFNLLFSFHDMQTPSGVRQMPGRTQRRNSVRIFQHKLKQIAFLYRK